MISTPRLALTNRLPMIEAMIAAQHQRTIENAGSILRGNHAPLNTFASLRLCAFAVEVFFIGNG